MNASRSNLRVAIDTGGTFTDCVWVERGRLKTLKVFSTPDDPSRAILAGVQVLLDKGVRPQDIFYFCHGTTVGTNALLDEVQLSDA